MKNKELFDKTVGILVKAYQEGTLKHNEPCGCAIGNLIAGNNGIKVIDNGEDWSSQEPYWGGAQFYGVASKQPNQAGLAQLASTGYPIEHTCQIEKAFERCDYKGTGDVDGYLGLMSVIDALMIIHEANIEETQQGKGLFVLNK